MLMPYSHVVSVVLFFGKVGSILRGMGVEFRDKKGCCIALGK